MADTNIPDAPAHLPVAVQKKWTDAYTKALKQAAIDSPEDESKQRATAAKEANRLLAVPAPESADDIDNLEDWQVLIRGSRTGKDGDEKYCVTADGRKYRFPVKPAKK